MKTDDVAPGDAVLHTEVQPRRRILVVEDDAAIREINTEVLKCSGYAVDAAADGAAAWDALQLNNYDLVVTDNEMPKVTGVELIQKLQAARMVLPVIMATGAVPEVEFSRCSLQRVVTLLKPYTFDELLAAVKEVLRAAGECLEGIALPPDWDLPQRVDGFRV